jgi:hypothetical protein
MLVLACVSRDRLWRLFEWPDLDDTVSNSAGSSRDDLYGLRQGGGLDHGETCHGQRGRMKGSVSVSTQCDVAYDERRARSRLVIRDAVDSLDRNHVTVDDVHDPVPADAQPVIPASVESLLRVRIVGKVGDGCADGPHAVLVSQVTVR